MSLHPVRAALVVATAAALLLLAPAAALAHESQTRGDMEFVVGFGTEPAYVGQPNSVQLLLYHDGQPVTDLGDTLDVDVSFGDQQPLSLSFEPNFEVGEWGEPGDYRAWFIPTSAGSYTFHITGTAEGEDVDETFSSGPRTFSDVESGSDISYPIQVPSTTDVAERIDREVPRLNDSLDEVQALAASASDDVGSARALGMAGIAIGLLGVAVGATALVMARRRA